MRTIGIFTSGTKNPLLPMLSTIESKKKPWIKEKKRNTDRVNRKIVLTEKIGFDLNGERDKAKGRKKARLALVPTKPK